MQAFHDVQTATHVWYHIKLNFGNLHKFILDYKITFWHVHV